MLARLISMGEGRTLLSFDMCLVSKTLQQRTGTYTHVLVRYRQHASRSPDNWALVDWRLVDIIHVTPRESDDIQLND